MAHGAGAIIELIDDSGWSYPVSVTRIEREHGLANVRLDPAGRHFVTVVELFAHGDLDRFEDEEDLREQVEPLVEAELATRRSGLLSRLRGLLGRR